MLDPTEAGWLAKYIEIRKTLPFADEVTAIGDQQQKLYAHLHSSGILYGHPIKLPLLLDLDLDNWPVKERMKLIFAEAFIASSIIAENDSFETSKVALDVTSDILAFYTQYNPELTKGKINFFSKKKSATYQAERIFDRRVKVKAQWNAGFWRGFFHNSLLFVDLIHYVDWKEKSNQRAHLLPAEQSFDIRWDALKLISMAINSDGDRESQHHTLFRFFIESAMFDKKQRQSALKLLGTKFSFVELKIDSKSPWLQRKYFLELAILCLWADRKISTKEEDFLLELCNHLGFDETDRDSSILSVQSFVMNNWDRIHYLQEKQNFLILRKNLTERMTKVAYKFSSEIKLEISESADLIKLLQLSNSRELDVSEKEQIRTQLFDILKSIPAFVIFILPFSFLTIPVLLKIIPKSAFPSSFDPNRLEIKKRNNRTIDS